MMVFAPLAMCAHFDGNPKKHKKKTARRRGIARRGAHGNKKVKRLIARESTKARYVAPPLSMHEQALVDRYHIGRQFTTN